MKRWIFLITLGVLSALLFRKYGFEGIYIASPSMETTLPVGTHYFVNKFIYFFRFPQRGEIVVFPSPVGEGIDLVKRIVGLPGETIEIREKKVFINGQPLLEPYAKYKRANEILVGDNLSPVQIPADSYFLMGDNRDESKDSATWKDPKTGNPILFIQRDRIKGKLVGVRE